MILKRVQHSGPTVDGAAREKILRFLDSHLRPNAGFSLSEEYPALFGDYPGGESLIAEQAGEVASHAGFLIREFQHGDLRLKVGLVGSVVTAPRFRGQGMAKPVMEEAIGELRRQSCVIALLWSDQPEFYRHLGFFRAGRERDYRFSAQSVGEPQGEVAEYDALRHPHLVWRLYQRHDVRLDRSLEEQKRLLRIPRTRVFVTEREGRVTSYLAVNKGADFTDYVHEWGGEVDELARNLAFVQKRVFPDRALTLISPGHYELGRIRGWAEQSWDGVLGLAKVLDRAKLLAAYQQYAGAPAAVTSSDSDETVLATVFGVEGRPVTGKLLPFFLWGFDSI